MRRFFKENPLVKLFWVLIRIFRLIEIWWLLRLFWDNFVRFVKRRVIRSGIVLLGLWLSLRRKRISFLWRSLFSVKSVVQNNICIESVIYMGKLWRIRRLTRILSFTRFYRIDKNKTWLWWIRTIKIFRCRIGFWQMDKTN